MDDKPVKRAAGGAAVAAVIVVLFLLSPMIYVLAIGPIVWLHRRGYVEVDRGSVVAQVYYPLEITAQKCQPLSQAIEAYVSLWEPPALPTQYAPMPLPAPAAPAASNPYSATTAPTPSDSTTSER